MFTHDLLIHTIASLLALSVPQVAAWLLRFSNTELPLQLIAFLISIVAAFVYSGLSFAGLSFVLGPSVSLRQELVQNEGTSILYIFVLILFGFLMLNIVTG
jgi:hypothetical protein